LEVSMAMSRIVSSCPMVSGVLVACVWSIMQPHRRQRCSRAVRAKQE
jgi:hypothetical protein